MATLLIHNLPVDVTIVDVRHMVARFGSVGEVRLANKPWAGPDAAVAFVEFDDEANAIHAANELNHAPYGNRDIGAELFVPSTG